MNPNEGSSLRIYGGPGEGDTGLIQLGPNWRPLPKNKGYRYSDKTRSAGGIQSILLRRGKGGGGRIEIAGGNANLAYQVTTAQSVVTVLLTIGDASSARVHQPEDEEAAGDGSSHRSALASCRATSSTAWTPSDGHLRAQRLHAATCHGSEGRRRRCRAGSTSRRTSRTRAS
jgi:hypothetical protein